MRPSTPMPALHPCASPARRPARSRAARAASAIALAGSLALAAGCGDDGAEAPPVQPLAWAACPEIAEAPFQCATMPAPLDAARPDGPQIRIAAIRHPATGPAPRLGAIFFNPGGPGGVGTADLPTWIEQFPAALRERFDLVSWDPRGVGRSTAVRCFDSAVDEDAFKARFAPGYPIGGAQIAQQAALQAEFNRNCAARAGELLAHVSTADTARDLERLRRAAGEPSMNFLGVSYGTLVGATYANLFPEQVRAMVLDGNVDPVGYFADAPLAGTGLRIDNDTGTGATFDEFLRRCAAAGPARCAFAEADAAATAAKYRTLAERLRSRPRPLPQRPDLPITEALLHTVVMGQLFTVEAFDTFGGWTSLATSLQRLWQASDPAAAAAAAAATTDDVLARPRLAAALKADEPLYASDGAANAVQCGESPNPRDWRVYEQIAAISQARAGLLGPAVSWLDLPCADWPARAAAPYTGPWNRPTRPILVIGNTFDPSTAYVSSQKMASLLGNARLLTIDGFGHTVLLNPSACASNAQVRYFVDGALPAEGARCRQDAEPFAGSPSNS